MGATLHAIACQPGKASGALSLNLVVDALEMAGAKLTRAFNDVLHLASDLVPTSASKGVFSSGKVEIGLL